MRKSLFIIIVVTVLMSLPWLGRPFSSRGDPREALVAQAMLNTGNWISPPVYDKAVPSKPPLLHWLMAATSARSGIVSEWTARLPSALAFIAFMIFGFLFIEKRLGSNSAMLWGLILLASPEWGRASVSARVDTLLATATAASLFSLYAWWEKQLKGVPLTAIILLGAATLTKGPVGFALPIAIFLVWLLLQKVSFSSIIRVGMLIGLPMIGVICLWYLPAYFSRGEAFIDKIWYENFARLSSTMDDEPHKHSVLYLFGTIALGLGFWTVGLLISALRKPKAAANLRGWWRSLTSFESFTVVSALGFILFYAIPASKRSVYLLPAYPLFAVIISKISADGGIGADKLWRFLKPVRLPIIIVLSALSIASLLYAVPPLDLNTVVVIVGTLLSIVLILLTDKFLPTGNLSQVAALAIFCTVMVQGPISHGISYLQSPESWLDSFPSEIKGERDREFFSFGNEFYALSLDMNRQFVSIRKDGVGMPKAGYVFMQQDSEAAFLILLGEQQRPEKVFETPVNLFVPESKRLILYKLG